MIAQTPKLPYYAVIFTSIRTTTRTTTDDGYDKMAEEMEKLVQSQPGFLGMESARSKVGITVSYWESMDAIKQWKMNNRHSEAREKGRSSWYKQFKVRICKVEHSYEFEI